MVQTEWEPAETQPDLNPSCGTARKSFTSLNQFCCFSVAKSCPTLCDPMDYSPPGSSVLHCLPEIAQIYSIELVMLSNHLILCRPLLLLPSIFPSIRVFSNGSALLIRWPDIGVSASVLLISIQDWFPLGLTGLISLQSKGLSRVFQHHR